MHFDDFLNDPLAAFALELARESGALLARHFWHAQQAENKKPAGFDPVTEADRAAETLMRERIAARFPEHGIIGEEFASEHPAGSYTWVLDPIDGTRSFLCGMPGWTTLIALLHEGIPLLGVIHQPLLEFVLIGDGTRCWRLVKGKPEVVRSRATERLEQALAGTTLPHLYDTAEKRRFLNAVFDRTRYLQYDGDALFYAQVAAGRMDIAFDTDLAIYDTAALIPLVRGAGGVITDWDGNPDALRGDIIASANQKLHAQMLQLARQARER